MVYYNESVYDSAGNNWWDLFNASNTVSGGLFFGLVLLGSLYFIIFLIGKNMKYDNNVCVLASGFITSIIALILWLLGGVSDTLLGFSIALLIGSIIVYKVTEN